MGKRKDAAAIDQAVELADRLDLPVVRTDKGTLNGLTANRPHQGIVLHASALEFEALDAPPAISAPGALPRVWLALDEVTDPQNFGALLRSAFFLGVEIVVSAKTRRRSPAWSRRRVRARWSSRCTPCATCRASSRRPPRRCGGGRRARGAYRRRRSTATRSSSSAARATGCAPTCARAIIARNFPQTNFCAQFSDAARPLRSPRVHVARVPSPPPPTTPTPRSSTASTSSPAACSYALLAQRKLDV